MRYATVVLSWERGQLHPLDDAVAAAPDLRIETTEYVNPMGDGTHVELSRFRGDMDALTEVFERTPGVLDYEVPEADDGFAYVHYESTPLMDALLSAVFEHTIVLRWPIEFVDDGGARGIRVTLLGSDAALQNATTEIPAALSVTLERTGAYTAATGDPLGALTERQRALFETAMRTGYYEVPRETTQAELADALGVTRATVSERLRRLESTLLGTIAR